jgi:hypothetical protein
MQRYLWEVADSPVQANRQRRLIVEQFYSSSTPTSKIKDADSEIPMLADSRLEYSDRYHASRGRLRLSAGGIDSGDRDWT